MHIPLCSVIPLPGFILEAVFIDGQKRRYDLAPMLEKYPAMSQLKNNAYLYSLAKPDIGGHGVIWNDEIDLDADDIYESGVPVM